MMIIFEGSDCVGKTSLINEFTKLLPKGKVVQKHYSSPPKIANQHDYCRDEYFSEIERIAPYNKDVTFVYDRFFFGERIYAPIYRGYYPDYNDDIEKELNDLDAILVHVTAKPETVKKRFDGIFIKEQDIPKIIESYYYEIGKSTLNNIITIETDYRLPEDLADDLYKRIYLEKN